MTISITKTPIKDTAVCASVLFEQFKEIVCRQYGVKNLKFISAGAFATVYHHPKNKKLVIKIALRSDGYIQYIKWCAKHQDNPYVPKLQSIDEYEFVRGNQERTYVASRAVIVEMEKLHKTRWSHHFRGVLDYMRCGTTINPVILGKLKYLQPIYDFIAGKCRDIHADNIMMRGRTPVITDPIAG